MEFLKDRRVILALGALAAILLGATIAATIAGGDKAPAGPPPASQAGLVVEQGRDDDARLDPARPIRCFVEGQFAGEITLSECARRNGVATGALDVGVDETGALAAASAAGTVLTPLPPPPAQMVEAQAAMPPAQPPAAATPGADPAPAAPAVEGGACWRYADASWSRLPEAMGLSACVQRLFAGQCERPGRATYGRWGNQTLRLVPGKVEISDDNRRFRLLARQEQDCSFPGMG
jgi:hypothetical protein